jgi:DNA (cytosine-5)-methyltransferase 1
VKFISLFAGVGGFDEGMRRAGHECVAMVEWDKSAAGVLAYRYPGIPLYCDVSKVEVDDLPDCDFLTYGFPCQDLSVAGKRKGLEGERSGLFFEATRLIRGLHARGSRFRFAVAENVKGLFSADDGLAFARCIRELQQCGASEVGWSIYDSQYFGLAQRRKRVFIVSDFGGESCDQVLAITESLHGNPAPEREAGKGAPAGVGSGFTPSSYGGYERGCGTLRSEGGDIGGGSETLLCRASDQANAETLSDMSPTLSCNHGVGGQIIAQGADVYNGEVTGDTAATVTSATGIANASGPKVVEESKTYCLQGAGETSKTANGSGVNDDVAFTLNQTDKHAVCSWNGDVTPKSSEDVSVTLRSQQGGEGVGVAFTASDRSNKAGWTSEVHGSLNCQMQSDTSNLQMGVLQQDNPQMNATLERVDGETVEGMCEMRGATMVRRLTPMECERLQGFPDGWTEWKQIVELEGNEWVRVELKQKQKDGPRYRQMGNAVSVPVAEYIGRRMAEAVDE